MKRSIMIMAGALGLAAASLSGQAFAQTAPEAPSANVTFVTQQPVNEWLAGAFIGQAVHNTTGETVGDIKDLVFDRKGRISTVVIGVGGFLGMGEKSVGVPFEVLGFKTGAKGERMVLVALNKEALAKAPDFKSTEKAAYDKGAREKVTN